jgi:hypothetical protein
MPRRACILVATAGKVSSGVVVATTIRSISSAAYLRILKRGARAAFSARSEVVSPGFAMRRLANARALDDPFVAGVDALGESRHW